MHSLDVLSEIINDRNDHLRVKYASYVLPRIWLRKRVHKHNVAFSALYSKIDAYHWSYSKQGFAFIDNRATNNFITTSIDFEAIAREILTTKLIFVTLAFKNLHGSTKLLYIFTNCHLDTLVKVFQKALMTGVEWEATVISETFYQKQEIMMLYNFYKMWCYLNR